MVMLRRRLLKAEESEGTIVETEVQFTPLSGSGTEKTSKVVDATEGDAYYTIPFVEGDSRLVSGATASSTPTRTVVNLYSDAECSTLVGYYFYNTKQIKSSAGTQASRPVIPFDTEILLIPKGYYAKIRFSRSSVTAFNDNSNMSGYITVYANTVKVRKIV